MSITFIDDDGLEHELPSRFELCPHCEGAGKSSAYLGAYTWEEMDEAGPDFIEDYFNGAYDRTCPECNGLRVIEVLDRHRIPSDLLEQYDAYQADEAEYQAIVAAERRMGA